MSPTRTHSGLVITWRLARRLALGADPRQRWRQGCVVLGTLVSTLLLLSSASIIHLGERAGDVVEARSPVWAVEGTAVGVTISLRGIVVPKVGQVPVVWVEPKRPDASPPPGLTTFPEPGTAVLSPGLRAAGVTAIDFGLQEPSPGKGDEIAEAGLASLSEGLVYARPLPGRTLRTSPSALLVQGWGMEGPRASIETSLDVPSGITGVAMVAGFGIIPALALLLGSARTSSSTVAERRRVLHVMGVSRGQLHRLAALETGVLALIGAVTAWLVWWAVVRTATSVPLTDVRLVPDSLGIPLTTSVVLTVLSVVAAACASLLPRADARWRVHTRNRTAAVGLAPLAVGLVAILVGPLVNGSTTGETLMVIGAFLVLVGLPVAMTPITRSLGHVLSATDWASTWYAGRRLRTFASELSRPAALIGMLAFVVGTAYALLAGLQADSAPDSPGSRSVWAVSWLDPQPGDAASLLSQVAPPLSLALTSAGPDDQPTLSGTCDELVVFFGLDPRVCVDPDGGIPPSLRDYLRQLGLSMSGDEPSAQSATVLVSAPHGTSELDVTRALRGLPAVNPRLLQGPSQFVLPGSDWFRLALVVGALALYLSFIRQIGERTAAAAREGVRQRRMGLRHAEAVRVEMLCVTAPVLIALPVGTLAAVLFALRGTPLGLTRFIPGLVAGASAAVSLATVLMLLIMVALHARAEVEATEA